MAEILDPPQQGLLIANEITRLHRENYGRGAARSRSVMGPNEVIVVLEDIYTPAERTLLSAGDFATVKEMRQEFQMAMRDRFVAAVEDISGRRVAAFMSQVHQDPDLAVEAFFFAPDGHD